MVGDMSRRMVVWGVCRCGGITCSNFSGHVGELVFPNSALSSEVVVKKGMQKWQLMVMLKEGRTEIPK